MSRPLLIGLSTCLLPGGRHNIYGGKPLQYVEASTPHWLMVPGVVVLVLPAPPAGAPHAQAVIDGYAEQLDGLVLHGGADVWPGHYGEDPLQPEWAGDAERDRYEMALIRSFDARRKPILGLCRGIQVLNVAYGGSLYQDLPSQRPSPVVHDDDALFERVHHAVEFVPGTRLAALYPAQPPSVVNSIHHQAVKRLAPDFVVQARCPADGTVEAIWRDGPGWVMGVQWHPELHRTADAPANELNDDPLLHDFLRAARDRRGG